MEYSKPKYIIYAGVNGVGKSTLYNTQPEYKHLPRINTDEIAQSIGDWQDVKVQMLAGKKAIQTLHSYFDQSISFTQETTLCGKSILKNIKTAQERGYYIELHYVAVEDVEICKSRISHRVSVGGHGIPDEDVERRYIESFQNIKSILPYCNMVYFYDNTDMFHIIGTAQYGKIEITNTQMTPKWFLSLKGL